MSARKTVATLSVALVGLLSALACTGGVASKQVGPFMSPTTSVISPNKPASPEVVVISKAPPTPAVPSISDGTWTVGEDFPAGTYKTKGAGSMCYWSIYKSGTNQSQIVDNHLGAGNLTVVLKVGQDFETQDCGTWVKAG